MMDYPYGICDEIPVFIMQIIALYFVNFVR